MTAHLLCCAGCDELERVAVRGAAPERESRQLFLRDAAVVRAWG